jgi:hypothetical protein
MDRVVMFVSVYSLSYNQDDFLVEKYEAGLIDFDVHNILTRENMELLGWLLLIHICDKELERIILLET